MARGDVLDISILVKSIAWHNERNKREQIGQKMPNNHGYSTDQLMDMFKKVKG